MRNSRGFTLIEVLVALIIVAAAIMASASLWSGNFTTMRKSALNYDVATILERKMVELETKYSNKSFTEIPEEEEGDFGSEFPQFRWQMKSRDMEFPDLTPLIAAQNEKLVTIIKQMTEYLNKAIKEVKVSVFVKRNKKEAEFSATEYFVDYNKDVASALGGAAGGGAGGPAPGGAK
jgi:general secretion pathway protein I